VTLRTDVVEAGSWKATARVALAHGASAAFVAMFSYITASLVPWLHEAYWAPITAVVVLYPDRDSTRRAGADRFLGTLIGSVVGWISAVCWGGHLLVYGAFVTCAVAFCYVLRRENAARLCAVAVTVITLIPRDLPASVIALHRSIEVSYGVACAIAFTMAVDVIRRRRGRE
jgi:uncharacterized membrane protein YccC